MRRPQSWKDRGHTAQVAGVFFALAGLLLPIGCSEPEPYLGLLPGESAVNRRVQLWEVQEPSSRPAPVATRPAATQPVATRPAPDTTTSDGLTPPYQLNAENIIRLVFKKSPLVSSSRENMTAAQYALEEFEANLSRFEPFVRSSATLTDFPERRASEGLAWETTGGIEKETFDGAVIRLEGGGRGERVEFGQVEEGQEAVEEGTGGLVRARVEIPFAGSRKRQDRVISRAFQESSARKAVLRYLSNYRSYVNSALTYYRYAIYYLDYVRAYTKKLDQLEALMADPRVPSEDLSRLNTTAGDTRVLIDSYKQSYRTYLMYLLQYTGIAPEEEYELQEPQRLAPSRYYERTLTEEGQKQMLAEAYDNNPQFQVLEDAIDDAELKRAQAMQGTLDITMFGQGTQFAFGSKTFDDRVGGWEVTSGVTLRLNDQRVLTASQKKAEAEIRSFRAQIEAEQLSVQQQIATESDTLRSNIESREQILDNIEKGRTQFEERSRIYLAGESATMTVDDVLTSLSLWHNAELRLANNVFNSALAEDDLMSATGEVYRLVGMRMAEDGGGVEIAAEEQ